MNFSLAEPTRAVLQALVECSQQPAWIVGGTLRDALLGRPSIDVDVVVDASAQGVGRALAAALGASFVPLDPENDIARVVVSPRLYVDIARQNGPSLEADVLARDFTCNALAAPILPDGSLGPLFDPCDGQADCRAGIVRACSPTSITADPLRMLRAVRFATQLNWQIDPALAAQIRQHAALIATVSMERCRDELLAILAAEPAVAAIRYLDAVGVLTVLIPELIPLHKHPQPGHVFDVWEHTLDAMSSGEWLLRALAGRMQHPTTHLTTTADDPFPPAFFCQPAATQAFPALTVPLEWAEFVVTHMQQPLGSVKRPALWKLALLCHDIAKPATRADKAHGRVSFHGHQTVGAEITEQIGQRLRLSRAAIGYLATVVEAHMRPGQLRASAEGTTTKAAYRFFRSLDEAAIDTLLHGLADHLASTGPRLNIAGWNYHCAWVDAMLAFQYGQPETRHRPLIDGHGLMRALGIPPGPQVGQLLEAIREAQATGTINTIEEALTLARSLIT